MPSIRRSLIVYFLLLLSLALSGMAFLANHVTDRALADKEEATVKLTENNAREREKEERDKFDRDLLSQARVAARTADTDYAAQVELANRRLPHLFPLALAAAGTPAPTGGWAVVVSPAVHQPLQAGRGVVSGPAWNMLFQANYATLRYDEFLIRNLEENDQGGDLFQIHNSARGLVWQSARLPAEGLPFVREKWDAVGEDVQWDTLTLPAGEVVRRVVLKNTLTNRLPWFALPPRPPASAARDAPPRSPTPGPPPPNVNYYHVARSTAGLEKEVADLHADAGRQKEALRQATADTRRTVRWLLVAGSAFTFLGLLVGGWVLVGVGLGPLRKLTHAVSRVNENDLRLPVRADELSHELVPIHARLAKTLDQLREAFEREKQAVADISHELRTPVAGLLATVDVTLRKPRTAEQYRQALDDCRGITRQLAGLVERVMTLAYLDAGQGTAAAVPTDPGQVASGCAAVIRPLAEAHGLTLTTDLHPTPPVATDPDKLREVVLNLLHNAVEYNRPGGSVRLGVRAGAGGGAVVEVSDTGIGMTPDVRGRIFERFYRADPSRTATGVHAGLGLAIVKEYVARLGGTIGVESEPDRGSTFRVTLPG